MNIMSKVYLKDPFFFFFFFIFFFVFAPVNFDTTIHLILPPIFFAAISQPSNLITTTPHISSSPST